MARLPVDVVLTNTIPAEGSCRRLSRCVDSGAPGAPPRSTGPWSPAPQRLGRDAQGFALDGKPVGVSSGSNSGAVISMTLDLPAGKPVNLHLDLTEPVLAGDPLVPVQPMVQPQQTDVAWSPASCGRVAGSVPNRPAAGWQSLIPWRAALRVC